MESSCDITLCSRDNRLFKVHSKIVCESSRFIKEQLQNVNSTRVLKLEGVNSDVLEVTIAFIYGKIPELMSDFRLLQKGAKDLMVHDADAYCRNEVMELLKKKYNTETCVICEFNPYEDNECHTEFMNTYGYEAVPNYNKQCISDIVQVNNKQIDNAVGGTDLQNIVLNNPAVLTDFDKIWNNANGLSHKKIHMINTEGNEKQNGDESNIFTKVVVDFSISPHDFQRLLDDLFEEEDAADPRQSQLKNSNGIGNGFHASKSRIDSTEQQSISNNVDGRVIEVTDKSTHNNNIKKSKSSINNLNHKNEVLDNGQGCIRNEKSRHYCKKSMKKQNIICEECGELFNNPQHFMKHMLVAHKKGELFSCTHCTYKTPVKKDIKSHMISRHGIVPPDTKVFSCNKCPYQCADRGRYNEHHTKHSMKRDFLCDVCSKMFSTKRGLRNHLMYHNDQRPYECDKCTASFKVGSKLRDHMRLIHSQKVEKPFKCGYCDFHASVRGNVNQHIKKVHKINKIIVLDKKREERRFVKKHYYEDITGHDINSKKIISG